MALITIKIAKLSEPLESMRISASSTVKTLIEKLGVTNADSLRVNGERVKTDHRLNTGDIVSLVPDIEGGSR